MNTTKLLMQCCEMRITFNVEKDQVKGGRSLKGTTWDVPLFQRLMNWSKIRWTIFRLEIDKTCFQRKSLFAKWNSIFNRYAVGIRIPTIWLPDVFGSWIHNGFGENEYHFLQNHSKSKLICSDHEWWLEIWTHTIWIHVQYSKLPVQ